MRVWFAKKTRDGEVAMTRFEALDLLMRVSMLMDEGRFGAAMEAIGMDPEVFAAEQTMEELAGVFNVRLNDLAKYAGLKSERQK